MNDESMPIVNKFRFSHLLKLWHQLNGEAAYERYLAHWHSQHAETDARPLSRKAFFADETRRKWSGVKRCC